MTDAPKPDREREGAPMFRQPLSKSFSDKLVAKLVERCASGSFFNLPSSEMARRIVETLAQLCEQERMVVVPVDPTQGLLVSMATRQNHAFMAPAAQFGNFSFGLTEQEREATLVTMRQIHEEVVLTGFYDPDRPA